MDYYVHKGGQQYGPYDEAAMQAMLAAGQVLPTDLCWNEQLPEWTAIGTALAAPAPVPAPIPMAPVMAGGRATASPAGRATASPAAQPAAEEPSPEVDKAATPKEAAKRKSGLPKIVGIAAGALVLIALCVGGWIIFSGEEKPEFVDFNDLEERNGLTYLKGESEPYTGKGKAFFPDGKPMKEVEFIGGKEHGLMITWYENGNKSYQANFVEGEYDGEVIAWTTNGVRQSVSVFKNGNEESRKTWDEKGNPIE